MKIDVSSRVISERPPDKCKWKYNCSGEEIRTVIGPLGPTAICAECYASYLELATRQQEANNRLLQSGTGLINLGQGMQAIGCAITLIVGGIVFLVLLASSC